MLLCSAPTTDLLITKRELMRMGLVSRAPNRNVPAEHVTVLAHHFVWLIRHDQVVHDWTEYG